VYFAFREAGTRQHSHGITPTFYVRRPLVDALYAKSRSLCRRRSATLAPLYAKRAALRMRASYLATRSCPSTSDWVDSIFVIATPWESQPAQPARLAYVRLAAQASRCINGSQRQTTSLSCRSCTTCLPAPGNVRALFAFVCQCSIGIIKCNTIPFFF